MDRIEDETVRYLFFLQVNVEGTQAGPRPVMPFPDEDEDGGGRRGSRSRPNRAKSRKPRAQATIEDVTRKIQRKKDKELAGLQLRRRRFDGAEAGERRGKVGRNDPCPCGSGKKYKKCHGAV